MAPPAPRAESPTGRPGGRWPIRTRSWPGGRATHLLDPETFDPLPQASDSEIVTLLAPVEVRIGWQVKVKRQRAGQGPLPAAVGWTRTQCRGVPVRRHHRRVGIRGLRDRLRRPVARLPGQGDPLEPIRGGHSPRSGLSHGVRPPQFRSGGPSQRLRRPADHALVVAKTNHFLQPRQKSGTASLSGR